MKTFPVLVLALCGILPTFAADLTQRTNDAKADATEKKEKKSEIKDLMKEAAFTNSTGMVMVKISPSSWAGKFEVTQEEYKKIIGGNPSKFAGDRNPVDSASYNDALGFCVKLNEAEKKEEMLPEGYSYTLPTQAQWETLVGGAELKDAVTSEKSSRSGTATVGSLGENSLGLCDVRGNLWEFCLDPSDQAYRVLRGAAWNTSYEPNLRVEFKWFSKGPDDKQEIFGFRCVMVPQ